jgi:hypothetical protein
MRFRTWRWIQRSARNHSRRAAQNQKMRLRYAHYGAALKSNKNSFEVSRINSRNENLIL